MVLRSSSHEAQVGSPIAHIVLTGESALNEVFLDVGEACIERCPS